jgi:hypothetical protein
LHGCFESDDKWRILAGRHVCRQGYAITEGCADIQAKRKLKSATAGRSCKAESAPLAVSFKIILANGE